jgi:hypothetical protein
LNALEFFLRRLRADLARHLDESLGLLGILQGRQPAQLTATRPTELDLPLDWTEQYKRHCQVEVF